MVDECIMKFQEQRRCGILIGFNFNQTTVIRNRIIRRLSTFVKDLCRRGKSGRYKGNKKVHTQGSLPFVHFQKLTLLPSHLLILNYCIRKFSVVCKNHRIGTPVLTRCLAAGSVGFSVELNGLRAIGFSG